MSRGGSCGACRHLRRGCASNCLYIPYFSHDEGKEEFALIHNVFGNHNVSRMINETPVEYRQKLVESLRHEAINRITDPILGSYGIIRDLQQRVSQYEVAIQNMQTEINNLSGYISFLTNQAVTHENILNISNNALLPYQVPHAINEVMPLYNQGPNEVLPSNLPARFGISSLPLPPNLPARFGISSLPGDNSIFHGSTFEVGSSSGQINYQDPTLNNTEQIDAQEHVHNEGAEHQVQHEEEDVLISTFIAPDVISVPFTGPM